MGCEEENRHILPNWLRATNRFPLEGHREVYVGKSPIAADKRESNWQDRFYKIPWVISHPGAKDKLFKCIGMEDNLLSTIMVDEDIALLVEEIKLGGTHQPPLPASYSITYKNLKGLA